MQIAALKNIFITSLNDVYDADEATNLMWWSIQEITSKPKKKIIAETNIDVSENTISKIIDELKTGKPIQYIFSKAYFYNLHFYVNENVLIPRPETEELVQWIITDNAQKQNITLIDLCTGSGCIAISTKHHMPKTSVWALDISGEAIAIAQQNAQQNQAEITFICNDVMTFSYDKKFNIIVSNPPYVCDKEKKLMHKNVLEHEPHLALFVDDDNALVFYEAIAKFGISNLAEDGAIYLEINERFAIETAEVFYNLGYRFAEIKKDINEKNRMLKIQK